MKIKYLLGLVMLGTLSIPQIALACDDCWGAVGIKDWISTFSPGGGMATTEAAVPMLTATIGYDKIFTSFSYNMPYRYSDPSYPFGSDAHTQLTFNLGYLINPEIFLALGYKREADDFRKNNTGGTSDHSTKVFYPTIGASYSHTFTDSPYSMNGSIAYGKGTLTGSSSSPNAQANNVYVGTLSGSSTYLSYEVGAGYSWSRNVKLNLGYRVEQYDQLMPTAVAQSGLVTTFTLAKQKVMLSGLIAGFVLAY